MEDYEITIEEEDDGIDDALEDDFWERVEG